jgi:hypothetical protein
LLTLQYPAVALTAGGHALGAHYDDNGGTPNAADSNTINKPEVAKTVGETLIIYPLADSGPAAAIGQSKRRRNDMDDAVRSSLTHEHLKKLGVASPVHRVKLPSAVAALRVDASIAFAAPRGAAEDRTERRQVTAIFSALVGSTNFRRAWT